MAEYDCGTQRRGAWWVTNGRGIMIKWSASIGHRMGRKQQADQKVAPYDDGARALADTLDP
jgi:hypothetical protein